MDRPTPVACMVSDEATFETYFTITGHVRLIMRPHGVEPNDERALGWDLTPAEVRGLPTLLRETLPDPEQTDAD